MFRKIIDNRFTNPIRPYFDRFCARQEQLCKIYERISNSRNPRIRDALFNQSKHSLEQPGARCALSSWQVNDGIVRFRMPMRPERIGFDWAHALSAIGHDVELKSIYRKVLEWSRNKSEKYLFIDCGANFGIHTAYHLSAGVLVHSFEPNPECFDYFSMLAKMNSWGLENWHACGLGAEPGRAELVFPAGETWLGSINDSVQFHNAQSLQRLVVPIQKLDQIQLPVLPTLMKIDVEGSEMSVLRGSVQLLRAQVEAVLFESWPDSPDRAELYAFFDSNGFDVARINAEGAANILGYHEFLAVPLPNMLAIRRTADPGSLAVCLR